MSGRVRLARLTDLAALGELSRLSQQEHVDARSLGLPLSGPRIGVFSLFRLPLGAFRPNDLLFVYEDERRLSGLLRVERDAPRDEMTIVELDAIGSGDSGDTRFRLVQHLLRDGTKRGAFRFHVACADVQGNVELFMQAGFARYGQELLLFRGPGTRLPSVWTDEKARSVGIRPCQSLDALPLALQDALCLEPQRDVVPYGSPRKQRWILKHDDPGWERSRDRIAVLAQHAGSRRLKSRDQTQQGRLAATGRPQQRDELAGLDAEIHIVEHRKHAAVDVEGVADVFDLERGADGGVGNRFDIGMRYHLTTPFCQISNRSRVRNNSVIAPEHNSDITISAAYMLE